MRLKSAALFAVGLLFGGFWLHGGARCQTSLAPPPLVTQQASPTPATCQWGGLSLCRNPATAKGSSSPPTVAPEVPMYPPPVIFASPPSATTQGASPPAAKNASRPMAIDDVPAPTAAAKSSARSAATKHSPPPANDKDAPAPATGNILATPAIDILPKSRTGKLSPSQETGPDGFTVGIDDDEQTGEPALITTRPKQSKVRQKADVAERPSAKQSLSDQAEIEKLKSNLTICRGC
ncbi:hypothetical protein [Bradyrhizobium sp. USDA 4449]